MTPYFTGKFTRERTGEVRRWLWWDVPMWEYTSDPLDPLTYVLCDGTRITPDRHILSDGMSSPPPLWGIRGLAQTDFPRAVYFHDSATQYGGFYVNGKFRLTDWAEANSFMFSMVRSEGGTLRQATRIYAGISLGMPFIWDERRQTLNRQKDGVSSV